MAYVSRPAKNMGFLSAGWRYSNGGDHFAHDYTMPEGTPLYAVRDGIVSDCNNGVVDHTPNRPGNYYWQAGAGSPSNWVLLKITYQGRPATVYYQHLKRTVVKKGQKVVAGQLLGYSGQTGNATGPHLHIAAMRNVGIANFSEYTRYVYMNNDGKNPYVIYPPSLTWGTKDFVRLANCKAGGDKADVLEVQKALHSYVGLNYSTGPGVWGPATTKAWAQAAKKSGRTGLSLLRFLGFRSRFTAIP